VRSVPGYYTYRDRFALALELVTTEYVCLIEDQECILWTGLQVAVHTLDAEPAHVCAGGLVAIAHAKPNETVLYPWGNRGDPWQLTNPDPLERFRKITGPDTILRICTIKSREQITYVTSLACCKA
jgi:hypothetical protein